MRNNYRDDSRERYRRRERKLRSMYRRRIFVVFVLALVLGILLGWIGCDRLGKKPETASSAPIATPEITQEPDPTPWADDEEEPDVSLDDWGVTEDESEITEITEDTDDWADWDAEETFGDEEETFDFGAEEPVTEETDAEEVLTEEEATFGFEETEELPFDVSGENPFAMDEDEDPFAMIDEESAIEVVEPVEEPVEEPAEEPVEEIVVEEPTEEPTAEPTQEPTQEPTEEPTAEPTEEPTQEPTEEPTEEPTQEPAEEPTAEPTSEPVEEEAPAAGSAALPVNLGEEYNFTMQVLESGAPRTDNSADYFEVPVTVTLTRHMDTQYYVDNYSTSYQLRGDEACCELKVAIGDCEGINTFSLQDALPMVLVDAAGNVIPGYQFRNAEIGGETESQVATGSSATIYKRYSASEEITPVSLLVTYYVDGQMQEVYFSLTETVEEEAAGEETTEETPSEETAPEATAEPEEESYTIGSSGEEVKKLQNKLIQLGYLSGVGDGEFGKWTAAAVKQAQEAFGLEPTGVADRAFLDILYSK